MSCRSGGTVCRSPGMFDFNRGSVWGDKDMRKKVWYPVSTDLVGNFRIRMRSVTCSVFFHLTPLYISDIFWNIIQSWFGLFCLVQSLFKLDTSINPVNAFLLWMPRAYHLSLRRSTHRNPYIPTAHYVLPSLWVHCNGDLGCSQCSGALALGVWNTDHWRSQR